MVGLFSCVCTAKSLAWPFSPLLVNQPSENKQLTNNMRLFLRPLVMFYSCDFSINNLVFFVLYRTIHFTSQANLWAVLPFSGMCLSTYITLQYTNCLFCRRRSLVDRVCAWVPSVVVSCPSHRPLRPCFATHPTKCGGLGDRAFIWILATNCLPVIRLISFCAAGLVFYPLF